MITTPTIKQLCRTNSPAPLIECMQILHPVISEIVDNINTMKGELIQSVSLVHDDNDKVCIQLVKENEEVIQSPMYGIEIWETLDLDNLPTNFAEGQELMITFLDNAYEVNTTDWNTSISTLPTFDTEVTIKPTLRFMLKSATRQGTLLFGFHSSTSAMSMVEFMVEDIQYLNDPNTITTMFQIYPIAFNGQSVQNGANISITRTNITTYIETIKRKM